MNMWKDVAKEYLEYSIKWEVYTYLRDSGVDTIDDLDEYCKYLEEMCVDRLNSLNSAIAKEEIYNALLNLNSMIDSYLDLLDWDFVHSAENGMEYAINGAYMWIDAISIFFVMSDEVEI